MRKVLLIILGLITVILMSSTITDVNDTNASEEQIYNLKLYLSMKNLSFVNDTLLCNVIDPVYNKMDIVNRPDVVIIPLQDLFNTTGFAGLRGRYVTELGIYGMDTYVSGKLYPSKAFISSKLTPEEGLRVVSHELAHGIYKGGDQGTAIEQEPVAIVGSRDFINQFNEFYNVKISQEDYTRGVGLFNKTANIIYDILTDSMWCPYIIGQAKALLPISPEIKSKYIN